MKHRDDLKMDTPSRKMYYFLDPSAPKMRYAWNWERQMNREKRAAKSRSHDKKKRNYGF